MNEFVGCVYSVTSTVCIKAANAGSSYFGDLVSKIPSTCGTFVATNVTSAYEIFVERSGIVFSAAMNSFSGDSFATAANLTRCSTEVLDVLITNAKRESAIIGMSVGFGGAGIGLGVIAGVLGFHAVKRCQENRQLQNFEPVSTPVARVVSRAAVSSRDGESSASGAKSGVSRRPGRFGGCAVQ
jgi:hypothetical protein